jgi:hypothetical protein
VIRPPRCTVPLLGELGRALDALVALRGEIGLGQQGAGAALVDDSRDLLHVEVVVREARDAGEQHLADRELGAEPHVPRRHVDLHGPDVVVEPGVGLHVLGRVAEHRHGGVRVRVHQAGDGDVAAPVDDLGAGQFGVGDIRRGDDPEDLAVGDADRVVLEQVGDSPGRGVFGGQVRVARCRPLRVGENRGPRDDGLGPVLLAHRVILPSG